MSAAKRLLQNVMEIDMSSSLAILFFSHLKMCPLLKGKNLLSSLRSRAHKENLFQFIKTKFCTFYPSQTMKTEKC